MTNCLNYCTRAIGIRPLCSAVASSAPEKPISSKALRSSSPFTPPPRMSGCSAAAPASSRNCTSSPADVPTLSSSRRIIPPNFRPLSFCKSFKGVCPASWGSRASTFLFIISMLTTISYSLAANSMSCSEAVSVPSIKDTDAGRRSRSLALEIPVSAMVFVLGEICFIRAKLSPRPVSRLRSAT
ncbi:MAG: hypothetical protein QG575_1776 [Euryarchaeota archaeon]|nr:hypothetical protein [Euryarchaeota archaeon]